MASLGKFKVKTNDTKGPTPPLPGQPPKGHGPKGAPVGVGSMKKLDDKAYC